MLLHVFTLPWPPWLRSVALAEADIPSLPARLAAINDTALAAMQVNE